MESTELAIANNQNLYISPVVGINEAKSKFEMVREYTAKCLTKDIDFGKVPGVSKPSLLKPGAEKICSLFGLTPKFTCVDKIMNWNGDGNPENEPFFYFEYRCDLYRGGEFVASCDASCNSWEKKYRYRRGELVCPQCGKPLRKSKNGDGFYCWAKQGGCGATFQSNDARVLHQKVGEVKNFDTAEQVNTFQKMAQKRAYVGATLIACNLSEYYTQDLEDIDRSQIQNEPPQEYYEGNFTPIQEQPKQEKKQFDEEEFLKQFKRPEKVQAMALANAEKYESSNSDVLYKDMTVKELYGHWCGLAKKFNDPQTSESAKTDCELRIAAICSILESKKAEKNL